MGASRVSRLNLSLFDISSIGICARSTKIHNFTCPRRTKRNGREEAKETDLEPRDGHHETNVLKTSLSY